MFAPKGANSPPARQSRAIRIQLGGLRAPVAQSSRWALAAPSARFAPHLRLALRFAQVPTGHTLPSGASKPPQKWWPSVVAGHARSSSVTAPARFKMRMRGLSRASGASQASAARNARNPRASVSSTLEAQETRLASPTGSQGHSPVRPSAAAGAPAPPASSAGRTAPRARKRFECPKDTRNASRRNP